MHRVRCFLDTQQYIWCCLKDTTDAHKCGKIRLTRTTRIVTVPTDIQTGAPSDFRVRKPQFFRTLTQCLPKANHRRQFVLDGHARATYILKE